MGTATDLTDPRGRAVRFLTRYLSSYNPRERTAESMTHSAAKGKLIAVIGDEDTCVGFLMGGVGELDKHRRPNFLVVDKNTSIADLEDEFKRLTKRDDIAIILISQNIAEMIRHAVDNHTEPIPAVLEIPSKDHPYDSSKDSILRRAKGLFSADDFR